MFLTVHVISIRLMASFPFTYKSSSAFTSSTSSSFSQLVSQAGRQTGSHSLMYPSLSFYLQLFKEQHCKSVKFYELSARGPWQWRLSLKSLSVMKIHTYIWIPGISLHLLHISSNFDPINKAIQWGTRGRSAEEMHEETDTVNS